MDESQLLSLLRAVAISSSAPGAVGFPIAPRTRSDAYEHLERFKSYDGRVAASVSLVAAERHVLTGAQLAGAAGGGGGGDVDVTAPTKLLALGVLQSFLRAGYSRLGESDRAALRSGVLSAARQLVSSAAARFGDAAREDESRILAVKLASLLSELAVRDFPQRWATFVADVMAPYPAGGLWGDPRQADEEHVRTYSTGYGTMIGTKMGLEVLRVVTEDCTDSDFNAKISTRRRNDVLIGLNEVSAQFLPQLYALLSDEYSIVVAAKSTLAEMEAFLTSSGRTAATMTADERAQYDAQVRRRDGAARLVGDALGTIGTFCSSMPLDWTVPPPPPPSSPDGSGAAASRPDFAAALLHLLREDTADLRVDAVSCLERLVCRKLEYGPWVRFVGALPAVAGEASGAGAGADADALAGRLAFHRGLSRTLALLLSSHLAHITSEGGDLLSGRGPDSRSLSACLNLMADVALLPSGRVCGEQIGAWIALLRDPQISRSGTLSPYLGRVLGAYVTHVARVRWEDVEGGTHPMAGLMEASWTDKEEYDAWLCDVRSKASQLFKLASRAEPALASSLIHDRVRALLSAHGTGEPRDQLDPATGRLTQLSEAVMRLEGIHQPLDCVLQGLPRWALEEGGGGDGDDPRRAEIRSAVMSRVSSVAAMIVAWTPADTWLKFRRAAMLDALKHYWIRDPSTLPAGVDALLVYLSAEDEAGPVATAAASTEPGRRGRLSEEVVGLRKKSGVALVSVARHVPHLLAPWLGQLSDRARTLLSSDSLLPSNRMHLYEFLSCAATAVEDPSARAGFVSDVLSGALDVLDSQQVRDAVASPEGMMEAFGIAQAKGNPAGATDPTVVRRTVGSYVELFSAFNQLLSVGKRCHEAAKKRPSGGIPLRNVAQAAAPFGQESGQQQVQQNFPDEGPVSLSELAVDDPFVPLWPRFLPALIRTIDVTLTLWRPEYQSSLLRDPVQRYALAISDDEAYLATKQDVSSGGVFGRGGTAGSVVSGWDRRDSNLAPKWSGWFNELRNTCLQLLGLMASQRAMFAPEVSGMMPGLVGAVANPDNLRAMEHRHLVQFLKQFVEILLLSCPVTLYRTHLSPILQPLCEHLAIRLRKTWSPILEARSLGSASPSPETTTAALTTARCGGAASLAESGGDVWYDAYYARGGLFVGDLEGAMAEEAVEKVRVDLGRTYGDVLQAALALKGEWALVLANQAKEEQALKRNDPSKLMSGPKTRVGEGDGARVNADGTPRGENEAAIEARKNLRIHSLCRFLLLEDERVAYAVVTSVIECLRYPDAYTCRRCTRICHRILETVVWDTRYTHLLGDRMFSMAVEAIVTEPRWMVGIEWDMINLLRDVYCRLALGQTLLPGGQGPAVQQPRDPADPSAFEQSRNVGDPLRGGGVLCRPSDLPRQVLAGLPGAGVEAVRKLDADMSEKKTAKEQKEFLRDLLRLVAENLKQRETGISGVFGRAAEGESLLNQKVHGAAVPDLPERLVTHSMMMKEGVNHQDNLPAAPGLGELFKLNA